MVAYTYTCIDSHVDPSAMRSFWSVSSFFVVVVIVVVDARTPGETGAARNSSLLSPSELLTLGERCKVRFTLVRFPAAFQQFVLILKAF